MERHCTNGSVRHRWGCPRACFQQWLWAGMVQLRVWLQEYFAQTGPSVPSSKKQISKLKRLKRNTSVLVAVQWIGALKLIFEQIFFSSAKIKSKVFKQRNKMRAEDGKTMGTHDKSKRSVGRGHTVFTAGAGMASCSWVCRARGAQRFPCAWHEPASGTDQNLNPLACLLLLFPVCVMMLWVTTRHLGGIQASHYSDAGWDLFWLPRTPFLP